jgi:hypothetical protein
MDIKHGMMRTLQPYAKSGVAQFNVLREFLPHLDGIPRKTPHILPASKDPTALHRIARGWTV